MRITKIDRFSSFALAIGLSVSLAPLSVLGQSRPPSDESATAKLCVVYSNQARTELVVYPLPGSSGGKCGKGSLVRIRLYKANNFLVDQICDQEKAIRKSNTYDPSEPAYDEFTCTMTGAVLDPNASFLSQKVVIR